MTKTIEEGVLDVIWEFVRHWYKNRQLPLQENGILHDWLQQNNKDPQRLTADELYYSLPLSIEETGFIEEQPLLASNVGLRRRQSRDNADNNGNRVSAADESRSRLALQAPSAAAAELPATMPPPRFMAHQQSMALNFELVGHMQNMNRATTLAPVTLSPVYVDREHQQVLLPQSTFRHMIDAIPWSQFGLPRRRDEEGNERDVMSSSGSANGSQSQLSMQVDAGASRPIERSVTRASSHSNSRYQQDASLPGDHVDGRQAPEDASGGSLPSRTVQLSDVTQATSRHQGSVGTALLVLSAKCLAHIPKLRPTKTTSQDLQGSSAARLLRSLEVESGSNDNNMNAANQKATTAAAAAATGEERAWFRRMFKLQSLQQPPRAMASSSLTGFGSMQQPFSASVASTGVSKQVSALELRS